MQPVTGPGHVVAGRYELLNEIGHGSMGTVWRARDQVLAREVAVKEVRHQRPMSPQERAVVRERSLREARVAARLNHPGVVTVHDVIEAEGSPWIVMELVLARSLARVIAEDGPMPPARAAEMGTVLLEALGKAHEAGIVHRDVKPGNVLITTSGRTVLTDFGIAQVAGDPRLTQAGMVMGTPGFCAPERIRGAPASPASDLWSLGATLYAAVEGRGPFEGQGSAMAVLANIVHGDPPPATRAGPLQAVILALMKRDPAARPDATGARRLLTAACSGCGMGTSASASDMQGAPDVPGASHGSGALDPAPAGSDGKGATADGALDEPGIRGGARPAGGTLPLPVSLLPDDAALAGQLPAEVRGPPVAASPVTASPVLASPVPGQPPTRTVSAHSSPASLATARTPAASGAVPASSTSQGPDSRSQRPGRHRRALLFGGGALRRSPQS